MAADDCGGSGEMLSYKLLRQLAVACPERCDDCFVLALKLLQVVPLVQAEEIGAQEVVAVIADQVNEARASRSFGDAQVKAVGELGVGLEFGLVLLGAADAGADFVAERLDAAEFLGRDAGCCKPGGIAFEHLAQAVDVLELLLDVPYDHPAGVWNLVGQPFCHQTGEGLADGGTAYAELLGEPGFEQPFARPDRPVQQGAAELPVGALGNGCHRLEAPHRGRFGRFRRIGLGALYTVHHTLYPSGRARYHNGQTVSNRPGESSPFAVAIADGAGGAGSSGRGLPIAAALPISVMVLKRRDAMPAPNAAAAGRFAIGGESFVNRLGFGAMRLTGPGIWGEPKDRAEALATLRALPGLGVNFIDTADSYGPYVSEMLIREALHPYREMLVATKGGLVRMGPGRWAPVGRPEYLRQEVLMSLRRLGVERIGLWQLHRIDPKVPREEQFDAIRAMRAEGLIRHTGLSNVSVGEIEAAQKFFPVATVQNRYNLADRASEAVLEYCARHKIGFIPWHPLAAGELARPGSALDAAARRHTVRPASVALAWLLQRSPAMLPIPGTSQRSHLEENVAAAAIRLDATEVSALDRQGAEVGRAAS